MVEVARAETVPAVPPTQALAGTVAGTLHEVRKSRGLALTAIQLTLPPKVVAGVLTVIAVSGSQMGRNENNIPPSLHHALYGKIAGRLRCAGSNAP